MGKLSIRKSKYTNTPAGYDTAKVSEKQNWWEHPYFPLMPLYETRKADKFNAASFNFSWLFLRIWSMEHFAFEISLEIESTGVNVKAIIGWVRIVLRVIPMPYVWLDFLRRTPCRDRKCKN